MKKLKRWLVALLAWELLVLSQKDKNFKKDLTKAQGVDKIKVVFDWLFNFNKKILNDLQATNLKDVKQTTIQRFEKESALLEEKLDTRENEFSSWSDEKLPIYLMWLETQFIWFEKKALAWKDKLVDEYNLDNQLELFKNRIEKAKNIVDKISENT